MNKDLQGKSTYLVLIVNHYLLSDHMRDESKRMKMTSQWHCDCDVTSCCLIGDDWSSANQRQE